MSTSSNTIRARLRAWFARELPEMEEGELPFDPEWEELLSWAEVAARPALEEVAARPVLEEVAATPALEPVADPVEAEEEQWAASIQEARERAARQAEDEEREWRERLESARRQPAQPEPAPANGNGASNGLSLRDRLERLAARARTAAASAKQAEALVPEPPSEEAEWQAAIQRAKTGNA